jgi:hypothetical protein
MFFKKWLPIENINGVVNEHNKVEKAVNTTDNPIVPFARFTA